jgi:hypothetical protein
MTKKDAELLVNAQFPDMDPVQKALVVRIMCGTRVRKEKHVGQKQKIGGRTCYISTQILPGHVGKKQRIYNSSSKGARLWRDMEARITGNTSYLEGKEVDKLVWEDKYNRVFMENIDRYRRNDPNHPSNQKNKKGGKK